MQYAVFFAFGMENLHQLRMVGAAAGIAVAERPDILFLRAREVLIQLLIEIFPVTFPQGHTHAEADNTLDPCLEAATQNPPQIFFRVVDKGGQC